MRVLKEIIMDIATLTKTSWKFSPIQNFEDLGFNKTLERFKNMGVNGLVRENIQNSLDGNLPGLNEPVVVKIRTGSLDNKYIPGIEQVKDHIKNLEGRNSYARETISHMQNKLNNHEVRYISFEDLNTKGLTGAKNGQSGSLKDTWGIYAYNKGVHFEEDDIKAENARGGSHGVGKIASNAASDLHVMYFANCDSQDEQHLGGTVQLIEHKYKDQVYRSTGYFTDIDENNTTFYPYENNFHDVLKKDTRGLKIIIPYLRSDFDNEKDIIKSVCDSFFISILNNKLEVQVNEKSITKNSILNYVKSQDYYEQEFSEAKKEFTPLYADTYLNASEKKIVVSNSVENFHFDLYFNYNEQIPKGRVAVVRTIGMKIEDFKVKNNATKPFNAVLIGGPKEDEYLKSLENESHTKLSKEHINDKKLKRHATKFINDLSREITKIIEAAINEHHPADGKMDTGDVLYVIENRFKKDLASTLGTVRTSSGSQLVKTFSSRFVKEKRNKKKQKSDKQHPVESPKRKRKNLKKVQKGDSVEQSSSEKQKERYSVHPEMVERIILNDKEIIKFDFTKADELMKASSCDISFSIIDGMGMEYTNEFDIENSYHTVQDLNTGQSCSFNNNIIKNVQIKKGVTQLQLTLNDSFNRSLKFVYYVEV